MKFIRPTNKGALQSLPRIPKDKLASEDITTPRWINIRFIPQEILNFFYFFPKHQELSHSGYICIKHLSGAE